MADCHRNEKKIAEIHTIQISKLHRMKTVDVFQFQMLHKMSVLRKNIKVKLEIQYVR